MLNEILLNKSSRHVHSQSYLMWIINVSSVNATTSKERHRRVNGLFDCTRSRAKANRIERCKKYLGKYKHKIFRKSGKWSNIVKLHMKGYACLFFRKPESEWSQQKTMDSRLLRGLPALLSSPPAFTLCYGMGSIFAPGPRRFWGQKNTPVAHRRSHNVIQAVRDYSIFIPRSRFAVSLRNSARIAAFKRRLLKCLCF